MEKWKIGVVLALLIGLAGVGLMQNQPPTPATPTPTETSDVAGQQLSPQLQKVVGTQPLPWSIPQNQWVNAPKPISPEDIKGSVTVIEFWRMGCSHCRDAVPFMEELYSRYKDKGLKIVTFHSPGLLNATNEETDWKKVQAFIKANNIQYPVAFDTNRQIKDKYTKAYQIDLYPFVLLVDKSGTIRYANTGFDEMKARRLAEEVDKLIK
jgi:thiol-disulfide isomerase/thioredoxin